jgi:hypothetical protein
MYNEDAQHTVQLSVVNTIKKHVEAILSSDEERINRHRILLTCWCNIYIYTHVRLCVLLIQTNIGLKRPFSQRSACLHFTCGHQITQVNTPYVPTPYFTKEARLEKSLLFQKFQHPAAIIRIHNKGF